MPTKPPRYDDTVLGIHFFRTMVAECKIERMSLPCEFLGRSEIRAASFRGTDLSESTANWNDFINVDFGGVDLSHSDFRASNFQDVRFDGAKLIGADLRHCTFTKCNFLGADLIGAKLTRKTGDSIKLSSDQQRTVDWQADDGEEPPGG